ncbi:MAG: hypothetical protein LBL66_04805 [Clostridiales bacterium]|jgi:hypothetical protein|nr:hypothetical protein [Clostridiales bacterium]
MPKEQTVKKRRTLIKIAVKKSIYTEGVGTESVYEVVSAQIATDPDGNPIYTDCFYCEWLNRFGSVAVQLEQLSVPQAARVRMPFVQGVYDALRTKAARIYKGGRAVPADTFELASSPDNYAQQNKMLEFEVKRIEAL